MRILWPLLHFWTKPIPAEPLALFRILLGLTILGAQLTGIFSTLAQTCGPNGQCPIEAGDDWIERTGRVMLLRGPTNLPLLGKWLPPSMSEKYPWLEDWVPASAKAAWEDWGKQLSSHYQLFAVDFAALFLLTVGFRPRLMALIAALLAGTFNHRLSELMNGADYLFCNGLYFLILAPSGATWSLDQFLRRPRARAWGEVPPQEPVLIEPWSVRLMQIQLCAVYLFTGLAKLGEDYINGVALYWVFNDTAITRWPYASFPIPLFVCRLLTWGTLAFEISFPFLVWVRPLRRWVLLAGLGLHLGILVTMELGWFSQVTLCWYALFLSGETLRRWAGRPRRVPPPAMSSRGSTPRATPLPV